ncbi:MAG: thiolase family protein [Myxococcales bacterium]|nr:MAG: thiolase family protein [Myxococcales bacterium]
MREAVIVAAKRTPVGRANRGVLKHMRVEDFARPVIQELLKTTGVKGEEVNDLVVGCAMPEAEQGMNIARIIGLAAGLPEIVPAVTVNRFCSSGLETIAIAATRIIAGFQDIVIAGGAETMSMIPMGGNKIVGNPNSVGTVAMGAYCSMGNTAENVVERYGKEFNLTREELDKFALRSQERALNALKEGYFKSQYVPIEYSTWENGKKVTGVLKEDEGPRPSSMESLASVKPAFRVKNGVVTAGNSSQMDDAAAFVLLMSAEEAKKRGLKIMAYFRDYQVIGVDPEVMGIGPAFAIPKLLQHAGLKYDDIDLYEINEAFASQAVYSVRKMGIEHLMERVNVNGGAIALGHPLGCTGAKLTTQLAYELERRNGRYGVVSMCIGGGMGAAGLFERPKQK